MSSRASFGTRYRGKKVQSSNFQAIYFSDLLEFLVKIDQGTEVHRYRAKYLPEMELFGSGSEVQRYTAQIVSRRALFVNRYRGTKVQSSNFQDICTSVPCQKSFIFGKFWVLYLCTSVP